MEERHPIPMAIEEAIEAGIPAPKAFRIYSDQTIPEVAEAAHLEAQRICMIEAGGSPTAAEAAALRHVLHIPARLLEICR